MQLLVFVLVLLVLVLVLVTRDASFVVHAPDVGLGAHLVTRDAE